jgi:hypothetical protein
LSETLANPGHDPRKNGTWRMIAYDDRLDVSVFLTDHDRVLVRDGQTMRTWTLVDPELELHDWLPPGQYALAMHALSRYSRLT